MSPAGENVGQGWIGLGIESDVQAELKRVQADVKRTMESIDRMDATADIDANIRGFQKDALYVKEQMAAIDKMEAEPKIKAAARKELQALNQELGRTNGHLRIRKAELNAASAAERKLEQAVKKTAQAETARVKALTHAEAAQRKMIGIQRQAIDMDQKRTIEVEKLRQSYARMLGQQAKVQRSALLGNAFDKSKLAQFNAEMDQTRHRIRALGGDTKDLNAETESSASRFGKLLTSMGAVRIQMGPLSGTLRQVATGFTVLGPVVFALAGQLASLVGVLGTGLLGALSVGSAALSGFGLSALGIGFILKPLIGELSDAQKASTAYGDAVRKYGKGSSEAKGKLEQLNSTLGDVSPKAREAFKNFASFGDRWEKLTAGARPAFFETIASGMTAANKLLPMFASESTKTFNVAAKAAQKWTKALSSSGGKSGIQEIMSNFREALPSINAGLMSMGTAFGRVSASASKLMPMLMGGFADWSASLSDSIGSGAGLDASIQRLVSHMQQLGRFAQSAGAMLATFFNAGANEGAGLLSTLTNIFNRWNAWMQTASGQNSLSNFFSQANSLGSAFVSTLGSMGLALFEFSQAFAPLAAGFTAALGGFSQIVAAVAGLGAARTVITGIGGALAGAFVAGKLAAAASAISGIATAIRAIGTGTAIATLTASINPFVLALASIGAAVAIFSTIGSSGDANRASIDALNASLAETKAVIDSISGADTEAASARLGVVAANRAAKTTTEQYTAAVDKYGKGSKEAKTADEARISAMQGVTQAEERARTATVSVAAARKKAVSGYKDDLAKANATMAESQKIVDQSRAKGGIFEALMGDEETTSGKIRRGLTDILGLTADQEKATEDARNAEKALATAQKQRVRALDQIAGSQLDTMRGNREQAAIAQDIGAAWRNVRDSLPKKAISEIVGEVDPRKAAAAVNLASSLKDMGKMGAASRILMNTGDIDKAIAKMRALETQTKQAKNVNVNAKVNKGSAERDLAKLGKGKTATINTKANTRGAESSLKGLSGKRLSAMLTIRANDSDATSKLNKVQRQRLKDKLMNLGASSGAADAAIRRLEGKKVKDKSVKLDGKANIAPIESADKKIQGVKDKTANLRTTADTSGVSSVQSAINSLPSEVVIPIRTTGSASRATGGPVAGGTDRRKPMDRTIDNAYSSARSQSNQPGKYTRPTLLVGEERKTEYVIATNPAYRNANTGYLSMAANDLGYDLHEQAAKGKPPKKPNVGAKKKVTGGFKGDTTAQSYAETRTRYDWLRGQLTMFDTAGTNERARQDRDIEAGRATDYDKAALKAPYLEQQKILGAPGSMGTLGTQIQAMITALGGSLNAQIGIDQGITTKGKNSDVARLKDRLKFFRDAVPKEKTDKKTGKVTNKKEIKSAEKRVDAAEKALTGAKEKDRNARGKIPGLKDQIAALRRELVQQLPGEQAGLAGTLADIDDAKPGDPGTGGGGATPMGVQLASLDKARYDFFNEFSSNIIPNAAGAFGAAGGGAPGFAGAGGGNAPVGGAPSPMMPDGQQGLGVSRRAPGVGVNAPLPVLGSGGAPNSTGPNSGGRSVTQNITIAESPPDPHTFTKQMAWEAGV